MTLSLRTPRSPAAKLHAGFSLVELMVALALSLILLAGVLAIFASSRTTYETTDRLSRIQENGRFALDSIVRDLRSAGYMGCSSEVALTNTLNDPTNVLRNYAVPVQGFDLQGTTWAPALDAAAVPSAEPEGDVLVIRRPRGEFEPVRAVEFSLMKAETDDILVAANPVLIKANDVVQVSDCNARTVFQVTQNDAGAIKHEIVAAAVDGSGVLQPGNLQKSLGYAYTDAAELVPVQSVVYFLRLHDPDKPEDGTSLWRRVSDSAIAEELVEGVENMQIAYGVAVGDKIEYRTADDVAGNWNLVRTVRIALLVRSLSEYGTDTDQGDYPLLGEDLGEVVENPGDRRLRQVFTTTVNLRNNVS